MGELKLNATHAKKQKVRAAATARSERRSVLVKWNAVKVVLQQLRDLRKNMMKEKSLLIHILMGVKTSRLDSEFGVLPPGMNVICERLDNRPLPPPLAKYLDHIAEIILNELDKAREEREELKKLKIAYGQACKSHEICPDAPATPEFIKFITNDDNPNRTAVFEDDEALYYYKLEKQFFGDEMNDIPEFPKE